jgi:hypothetical protein
MREYLFVFWGLVIAGMIIMTAACPECRQAATGRHYSPASYAVYNENGDRIFICGSDRDGQAHKTGRAETRYRF